MTIEVYSRALVTGATAGIGKAICTLLRQEGMDVLAVGRRPAKLDELAEKTGCRTLAANIQNYDAMSSEIAAFRPEVIINNAGVGHGITGLHSVGPDDISEAIGINLIAPIQITAIAVEIMKQEGLRGHIVNIGSIAGLHTLLSALYGAGKAGIHIFSQNLRYELRGHPIRVTEICPGRTSSEFYQAAHGDRQAISKMNKTGIEELQPEDIAEAILFALKTPQPVNVTTIEILPTEQALGGAHMTPLTKIEG